MYRRLTLAVFWVFALAAMGLAQQQNADIRPWIGTWKLNPAKGKADPPDPGPPPKSVTFKFEASGTNGEKITWDYIDSQGKQTHVEWTVNFDGQYYPVTDPETGKESEYTVAAIQVDANNCIRVWKKGGNVFSMLWYVVSKDGRTLEVDEIQDNATSSSGGGLGGAPQHYVNIYNKQ